MRTVGSENIENGVGVVTVDGYGIVGKENCTVRLQEVGGD